MDEKSEKELPTQVHRARNSAGICPGLLGSRTFHHSAKFGGVTQDLPLGISCGDPGPLQNRPSVGGREMPRHLSLHVYSWQTKSTLHPSMEGPANSNQLEWSRTGHCRWATVGPASPRESAMLSHLTLPVLAEKLPHQVAANPGCAGSN